MIQEAYCSFEVAKLLKEKGFDEPCYQKYNSDGELSFNRVGYINSENPCDDFYALAPTHQMAMAWLRNKKIYIQIRMSFNTYLYGAIILKGIFDIYATIPSKLKTYEEAVETALKYTLESLI